MHGHMGFGLGFLNLIGTVLFWVALIWTVRFFVRGGFKNGGFKRGCGGRYAKWRGEMSRRGGSRSWEGGDEADKLLRERLAKGDISEAEYTQLKAKLGENGDNGFPGRSANGGPGSNGNRAENGPLSWLRGDNALETARMRLAKGDITPDEFETIRRVLSS